MAHRSEILNRLLDAEAPKNVDHACNHCKAVMGTWRCQDCLGMPEYCTGCCRSLHSRDVFHRVEIWNGECYTPASLSRAGVYIHLGHGGDSCPTSSRSEGNNIEDDGWMTDSEDEDGEDAAQDFADALKDETPLFGLPDGPKGNARKIDSHGNTILVLVDVSGVHNIGIRWCRCTMCDPQWLQLLKMGLYATSFIRPRTAFTFHALDDYLIANKECKTTAMNYYSKLRRLTSYTFPHLVTVRNFALFTRSRNSCNFSGPISRALESFSTMEMAKKSSMAWKRSL